MRKRVNLNPHEKDCNFDVNEPIEEIVLDNLHLNSEMTELLSHLDTIDVVNPKFRYDTCALWNGEVKQKGSHRQPYCPYLPISRSVIRFIYEQVFCVRLYNTKDVLRHMCPLITGLFNSGLCCNPLHLRLGTAKENCRDILVHDLIKLWMMNETQTDFCFQHNTGMVSSVIQSLFPEELVQVKSLSFLHKLPDPTMQCCCDIIKIDPTHKHRRVELKESDHRNEKESDHPNKKSDKNTIDDSIAIQLSLPQNRPKVTIFNEF